MGLSLQELKSVMSPLSEIGMGESTFEVNGLTITLRPLPPEEELNVIRYARAALSEGDVADQATTLDYLDRFRNMTLGYSIVQVGDMDFRNVTSVETGEKLPNGVSVKLKKQDAIRGIVSSWSRHMTTAVFRKFGELSAKVESEVEKVIEFEDVDYDAEISRLEEKIADLKDAKAKHDVSLADPRTELRRQVAGSSPTRLAPRAPVDQGPTPESSQTFPSQSDLSDQPKEVGYVAVPDNADRVILEDPVGEPEAVAEPVLVPPRRPLFQGAPVTSPVVSQIPEQVQRPEFRSRVPTAADPLADVDSSFGDVNDEEVMRREHQRLIEMRSKSVALRPPHVSAREAFQEVQQQQAGPIVPSVPVPVGVRDGKEVYKMPTQVLSDRPPSGPAHPPANGSINPRFRPAPTR